MKLFVLNATEEFIANVRLSPPIPAVKAVCTSYIRDPEILGSTYQYRCTLEPESEADKNKVSSFLRYLRDRQKVILFCSICMKDYDMFPSSQAAVIKLDSGAVLYAYPPEASTLVTDSVRCFRKLDAREIVPAVQLVPQGVSNSSTSSSVASTNGGFLATLLGKASIFSFFFLFFFSKMNDNKLIYDMI
jgi:hypothetical protein